MPSRIVDPQRPNEYRTLAAVISETRHTYLAEHGWSQCAWEAKRYREPYPPILEAFKDDLHALYKGKRSDGWMDHSYRLTRRAPDGVVYVSEPYEIGSEGIRNLAWLIEQGWSVSITAGSALHFPSWTIAILVFQPDTPDFPELLHIGTDFRTRG
jgi:hypothetical protein